MRRTSKVTSGVRKALGRLTRTGRLAPLALGSLALIVLLPIVLLVGLGIVLPTGGVETDPFLVTLAIMTAGTLLIGVATLWWIDAAHGSPDRYGKADRPARG